jgi:hypothetical protein
MMRHARFPRFIEPEITSRRIAAHAAKLRRERERAGLFAAQVGELQAGELDAPAIIAQRNEGLRRAWAQRRSFEARSWFRARYLLRTLPPENQAAILAIWNRGWLPGSPSYLLGLIREQFKVLGIDVDAATPAHLRSSL